MASQDVHASSLGILCAVEAIGMNPLCILLNSFRSLQSILGLADCMSFFAVKEVHEFPSILLWRTLEATMTVGVMTESALPNFFFRFSLKPILSLGLVSMYSVTG